MRRFMAPLALFFCPSLVLAGIGASELLDAKDTYWYFDADTALAAARATGKPIYIGKIRADGGGSKVKT